MKKIILYSLIVLTAVSSGCSDFLDKYPSGAIPEKNAMKTFSDAEQHRTGIYSQWVSPNLYSGLLTLLPDIQADLVYMVNGSSNTYAGIYRWELLPSASELAAIYSDLYAIIARCNFYLDNIENVEKTVTDKVKKDKLERYTGEVYFSRALAYSELIKLFCEAYDPAKAENQHGVSITTSYKNNSGGIQRSNMLLSYKRVTDDLDAAEEIMNRLEAGTDKPNSAYVSPGAVAALKARVYLYMKDYDNAIKYSSELLDQEKFTYRLDDAMTILGSGLSEYQNLWYKDTGNEVIWRIGMTPTDLGGRLSYHFHKYDYVSITPDYVPAQWALNLYGTNDKRKSAFFQYITTSYDHGLQWFLLSGKYFSNPDLDGSGNYRFVNMPKVFRLSEQYLIRAEAYYFKGKTDEANKDLADLRKARIANYVHSKQVDDKLFEEIKNERVKELFMEGFRLQDLKRWDEGFTRKPQQQSVSGPDELRVDADNKRFVWPIPQHEVDAYPDIYKNPSNK